MGQSATNDIFTDADWRLPIIIVRAKASALFMGAWRDRLLRRQIDPSRLLSSRKKIDPKAIVLMDKVRDYTNEQFELALRLAPTDHPVRLDYICFLTAPLMPFENKSQEQENRIENAVMRAGQVFHEIPRTAVDMREAAETAIITAQRYLHAMANKKGAVESRATSPRDRDFIIAHIDEINSDIRADVARIEGKIKKHPDRHDLWVVRARHIMRGIGFNRLLKVEGEEWLRETASIIDKAIAPLVEECTKSGGPEAVEALCQVIGHLHNISDVADMPRKEYWTREAFSLAVGLLEKEGKPNQDAYPVWRGILCLCGAIVKGEIGSKMMRRADGESIDGVSVCTREAIEFGAKFFPCALQYFPSSLQIYEAYENFLTYLIKPLPHPNPDLIDTMIRVLSKSSEFDPRIPKRIEELKAQRENKDGKPAIDCSLPFDAKAELEKIGPALQKLRAKDKKLAAPEAKEWMAPRVRQWKRHFRRNPDMAALCLAIRLHRGGVVR
ncbi:MAG: hypothetical protein EYC62_09715 [Alphaproteobacteria bacterium]|nr:MAG: hypothetical protein EYC62_09715 [Alphaproteobacteria bacterium]